MAFKPIRVIKLNDDWSVAEKTDNTPTYWDKGPIIYHTNCPLNNGWPVSGIISKPGKYRDWLVQSCCQGNPHCKIKLTEEILDKVRFLFQDTFKT